MTPRRKADTLERLQRIFQQQLAIDQALDHTRQRLRDQEEVLQERARLLDQWEAAMDALDHARARGDPSASAAASSASTRSASRIASWSPPHHLDMPIGHRARPPDHTAFLPCTSNPKERHPQMTRRHPTAAPQSRLRPRKVARNGRASLLLVGDPRGGQQDLDLGAGGADRVGALVDDGADHRPVQQHLDLRCERDRVAGASSGGQLPE